VRRRLRDRVRRDGRREHLIDADPPGERPARSLTGEELPMSVLVEKVNASPQLAALPLRSAEIQHTDAVAPTVCTPAAIAAGAGAASAVVGAFAGGYAVGAALGG
jgi:hypothetical protein